MADAGTIQSFEDFVKVHGLLLAAAGVPQSLYRKLFEKLSTETFDGGNYFQVEPVKDGRQRRLVLTTSDSISKESNIFLVDHAWSFRLSDAPKQLQQVPGLAERMASLMCVDIDLNSDLEEADNAGCELGFMEIVERQVENMKKEGHDAVVWLELDELDIDDDAFVSLDLPSKFPDLIALSLCGNKLKITEMITKEVVKFKHLRALWLNNNPIIQNFDDHVADVIIYNCPRLEILNSSFTRKYTEWALGFCGGIYDKDSPGHDNDLSFQGVTSLDLSNRRIHSLRNKGFSPAAMPSLSYLNLRGNPLDDDSISDLREFVKSFTSLHVVEVDIPGPLGDSAVEIAESLPTLSLLNGVNTTRILESGKSVIDSMLLPRLPEWIANEPLVDRVLNAMWSYLMSYRLADEDKIDETSVWYVMDELGSALRHSDEPNFRVSPFLYMPEGKLESAVSFTLAWPTKNVKSGDECTRDYLFGIGEEKQRSARLTAWFHTPHKYFEYEKFWQNLRSTSSSSSSSSRVSKTCTITSGRSLASPLRVYTDIPSVEEFLTHPGFVITTEPKEADIIWTSMQVDEETKKATGLNDQQYINQFPFEACLVMKHHLAKTVQKAYGSPEWFQPTYNLETQLTQFIGDYHVREKDRIDNLWILKPWNMARTIDTSVTGNLSAIIRLMETGPKICQKYIHYPALFKGNKFDLRYIVLVRSMNPLELFVTDVFWVRLANNPYSLDKKSLFEYETHFTVMNYRGNLNHMNTPEFVKEFEQEHQVKWLEIDSRVKEMIRMVFESAALVHPEMHSPTSRAMYGVDVMLDSCFKPKLLEVTYCPDCTRACKYDTKAVMGNSTSTMTIRGGDFYNHVFGCLFLNETTHVTPL